MSSLPLTDNQNALLTAFDAAIDQAFEFGVSHSAVTVVAPVDDYAKFRNFRIGEELTSKDYTPSIKQMFKATAASLFVNLLTPSWTQIAPINGWSGTAYYWKDPFGEVHFRGSLAGGAQSTSPFALPYTPVSSSVVVISGVQGGVGVFTTLSISGLYATVGATPVGTYTSLNLDNVSYWTQ